MSKITLINGKILNCEQRAEAVNVCGEYTFTLYEGYDGHFYLEQFEGFPDARSRLMEAATLEDAKKEMAETITAIIEADALNREDLIRFTERIEPGVGDVLTLENGVELFPNEWNGEEYIVKEDGEERCFRPVHVPVSFDENMEPDQYEYAGFVET